MLNEKGYYRPSYEELVAQKEQEAKKLFGEDIDTSELSVLGKIIRMDAKDLSKAYEDNEKIYYSRYPNTAVGVSLDRLCPLAGITRNPATRATHVIRVFGEAESKIDEIVVCGDDSEITFHNNGSFVIPATVEGETLGKIEIIVECDIAGTAGNVNDITEIVNPIATVDHIEYVKIDTKATDEESDYELRKRFSLAIEGAGSTNANAIRAALLRIPTVISAAVIANDEGVEVNGRPPHSFECYVYGGEDELTEQKIAEAIFEKAPIGIKTCSTSLSPIVKEVVDDGGFSHTISFSHTENVAINVKVSYKKNNNFEEDGEEQIATILTTYVNNLGVGKDVILSTLYGQIHSVNGITEVSELLLGIDGGEVSANNVAIKDWQVAVINEIECVEVT